MIYILIKLNILVLACPLAFIGQWLGSYPRSRATETPHAKRSKGHFRIAGWHLLGSERVGAKRPRSQEVRWSLKQDEQYQKEM